MKRGFTLIELLVVVAIIGFLSSIVLTEVNKTRESAKISKAVLEIKEIQKNVAIYLLDTGQPPSTDCSLSSCTVANDPMLNSFGLFGWSGPYYPAFYNFAHPWGGQYSYHRFNDVGLISDWDGDGASDYGIRLNDDAPGTNSGNNQGIVPASSLLKVDRILDDGNLNTGKIRGGGSNFTNMSCAVGEICVILKL